MNNILKFTPAQYGRIAWERRFEVLPYKLDPCEDLTLVGKDRESAIATFAKWPNVTESDLAEFAAAYPEDKRKA